MSIFQPYTTDTTRNGRRRARNSMRLRLWADDVFAHRWLCHEGDSKCPDGCDTKPDPSRLALYNSDIEWSREEIAAAEKEMP